MNWATPSLLTDMGLLKSYTYSLTYQVVNVAIPVLTIPYLARTLGAVAIGEYAFLAALLAYFTFASGFALSIYGNREIAKVKTDPAQVAATFSKLFSLQAYTSIFATLVFTALLWYIFGGTLGWSIRIALIVQLAAALLDITWLFMGLEQLKVIAMRNILIKMATLIFVFLLVKSNKSLTTYAWILSGSTLAGNIYCARHAIRIVKFQMFGPKSTLLIARSALGIFIPQLVMNLYGNADRVLLGLLAPKQQLAIYDQGLKVVMVLIAFTVSLRPIMISRLSAPTFIRSPKEQMGQYSKLFSISSFIASFLCFGVVGASARFVPWFFGAQFLELTRVLPLLAFFLVVCSFGDVMINQIMVATGRELQILMVLIILAIMMFSSYWLIIPRMGAFGAALAMVGCNTIILLVEWGFLRDMLDLWPILRGIVKDLTAGALMGAAIFFVGQPLPSRITTSILQVLVAFLAYAGIQFLLRNQVLLYLINFVMSAIPNLRKQFKIEFFRE